MTSPDYIDYFFGLSESQKRVVLSRQSDLYKGINQGLINAICDQLAANKINWSLLKTNLYSNCSLKKIDQLFYGRLQLLFEHAETEQSFSYQTDAAILATGYKNNNPGFLEILAKN